MNTYLHISTWTVPFTLDIMMVQERTNKEIKVLVLHEDLIYKKKWQIKTRICVRNTGKRWVWFDDIYAGRTGKMKAQATLLSLLLGVRASQLYSYVLHIKSESARICKGHAYQIQIFSMSLVLPPIASATSPFDMFTFDMLRSARSKVSLQYP
jgi:hypothetical protein